MKEIVALRIDHLEILDLASSSRHLNFAYRIRWSQKVGSGHYEYCVRL